MHKSGEAPRQRPATMTPDEVDETLQAYRDGTEANGEDPFTRLGWRPAWSIRSRRGAWGPFAEMVREWFWPGRQ